MSDLPPLGGNGYSGDFDTPAQKLVGAEQKPIGSSGLILHRCGTLIDPDRLCPVCYPKSVPCSACGMLMDWHSTKKYWRCRWCGGLGNSMPGEKRQCTHNDTGPGAERCALPAGHDGPHVAQGYPDPLGGAMRFIPINELARVSTTRAVIIAFFLGAIVGAFIAWFLAMQ